MHTLHDMVDHRLRRHLPFDPSPSDVGVPQDPDPMADWLGRPRNRAQAVAMCDGVIDLMSALFSVCGRQLRSPGRSSRAAARVRQIGMYVAHVTLRLRMVEVAAGFGRDKSTVVHACHVIEDLRDDEEFNLIVAKAEQITRVAFSVPSPCGQCDER